jgi:tetratricopeptide (TPR) repeat protein
VWITGLVVLCTVVFLYQVLNSDNAGRSAYYICGLCIPSAVVVWAVFQAIFLRRRRTFFIQATALLCIFASLLAGEMIGASIRHRLSTISTANSPLTDADSSYADQKLQEAGELGLQGDYSAAIRLASEVIDRQPECAAAYLLRGVAERRGGEYSLAIADFDRAIALNSRSSEAFTQRAWARQQSQASDSSKQIFADLNQAIALDANSALAHLIRGNEYAEANDHRAATADYNRAVRLNPRSYTALANRASSKMSLGQLDEAVQDLQAALELNPPVEDRRQIEGFMKQLQSELNRKQGIGLATQ